MARKPAQQAYRALKAALIGCLPMLVVGLARRAMARRRITITDAKGQTR